MDTQFAHPNRDSLRDSFKGLVASEIIFNLPFGSFQPTTLSLQLQFLKLSFRRSIQLEKNKWRHPLITTFFTYEHENWLIFARPAGHVCNIWTYERVMHTVLPDDAHGGKHPYNVPVTKDCALVRESHYYRLGLMRDLAMWFCWSGH